MGHDSQLSLLPKPPPRPTGDLWDNSRRDPVTVPVPLPVIIVRVEGPYNALDRKLWLVLLERAFPDLDKPGHVHEIGVGELVAKLREKTGRKDLGGRGVIKTTKKSEEETEAAALWQSVRRLAKTTVEWEDKDFMGINSLLSARMDKSARQTGKLYFHFDPILAQHVLLPRVWARLNVDVMLKLRSKYAVTLYEILEAYVNRRENTCVVALDELQSWLKVPEGAYPDWRELKKRVIDPAVAEINDRAEDTGFTVAYEGVREGKSFAKVKFTTSKTRTRQNNDALVKEMAKRKRGFKPRAAAANYEPSESAVRTFRKKFPALDVYAYAAQFRDHCGKQKEPPKNPDGAFIGWAESFIAKEKAA